MTAAFSDLLVYIMMYDLWPYANVFTCLHLVFSAPHTIDKRRVSNQTRERNYPDFSRLWSKFIVAIVSQNDRAIHACDQIRDTVFKIVSRYRYRSWSRIGIGIWIQIVSDTDKPASDTFIAYIYGHNKINVSIVLNTNSLSRLEMLPLVSRFVCVWHLAEKCLRQPEIGYSRDFILPSSWWWNDQVESKGRKNPVEELATS